MFGVHRPTYRGVLWRIHEGLLVRYGADGPPAEPGLWWYVVRNRIEAAGHKLWAARVGSPWDEALVKKVHKLTNRESERVPVGSMMLSGVGPPRAATAPSTVAGLAGWWRRGGPFWADSARTSQAVGHGASARVWDDVSGHARHLTTAAASNRVLLDSLSFPGSTAAYFDGFDSAMTVPAGLTIDVGDYTLFVVFAPVRQRNDTQVFWSPGPTTDHSLFLTSALDYTKTGASAPTLTAPNSARQVLTYASRPAGQVLRSNGNQTTAAAIASSSQSGGFLGQWDSAAAQLRTGMAVLEVLVYGRGLSDAEITLIESYLGSPACNGPFPVGDPLVIFHGNSITPFQPAESAYTAIAMRTRVGRRALIRGVNGAWTGFLAGEYAAQIAPLWDVGRSVQALVFWEITNDLRVNGATGAQAFTNASSYCSAPHAAGIPIVIGDCIDRQETGQPADFQTQRADVNARLAAEFTGATSDPTVWLRAPGSTFPADVLVRASLIPEAQDASNATYFDAAKVHPTAALHALLGPKFGLGLAAAGVP